MSDIIDKAQAIEETLRDAALSHRRPEPTAKATGACLNCDAPLPPGRRWCNAVCRDEWTAEQAGS